MDSAKKLRFLIKFKISDKTGIESEVPVGPKSAVIGFAGVQYGIAADGFSLKQTPFNTKMMFVPLAYLEYRYYYNIGRRCAKEKNTKNNAANFIYGQVVNLYPVKNQNGFGLLFTQGWGLQRVLGKRRVFKYLNYDFHAGVAEHFYYDKQPGWKFNYMKIEEDLTMSFSFVI